MDKTIKISEDTHKKICALAKKQRRSRKVIVEMAVELLEERRK